MQRSRDSSGLNWNPHFMAGACFEGSAEGSAYAISVGTLSEVMPDGGEREHDSAKF